MSAPRCQLVDEGKVCAWCRPGVDAPGGHGICVDCLARELTAAGLVPPQADPFADGAGRGRAKSISPRE